MTVWLIQRVRRLHRDALHKWEGNCREAIEMAEAAANDKNVLYKLRLHWLGTAVVLARLINRPFGALHTPSDNVEYRTVNSPISKVMTASVSLQDERDIFLQRALPELTPPGWLIEQYRRISDQYAITEQLKTGTSNVPRPEWCAYPVNAVNIKRGKERGRRWPLAYKVYSGEFDDMLKHAADEALSEALIKTLHDASVKAIVADDTDKPKYLTTILGRIITPDR